MQTEQAPLTTCVYCIHGAVLTRMEVALLKPCKAPVCDLVRV